jgi:hypothetical protein
MHKLNNGTTLTIARDMGKFVVTHFSTSGMILDEMACDTFEDAQFAIDIGPDRW